MPIDIKPSTWLGAGYSASSGAHTITLQTSDAASNKTLPQLTDAKAHVTTGDIRHVAFALADALYKSFLAQVTADNRTTQMSIQRSEFGDSSGNSTYQYQFTFTVTPTGIFDIPSE
jgi:hypothetical protein